MKLTKKLQAEILKIYHAYWDAYLAGDMKTFASMLDDNIKVFGTAVSEVFNNKAETILFYKATADQLTGKVEFRNRKIKMNSVDETVLIHEQGDLFVLIENEWIFYSPLRVSAIFVNTPKGWKLTHQHGSFPDSRAEAGEQIAPEKIRKENLELREAIKRRTLELENKNRELEIEASLEKVRAVAMGMREPADMLDVCKTISLQLLSLGVKEIRNVQTAIFYEPRGTYMNYEYYSMHDKTIITETVFTNNKIHNDFATKMMRGKGETFITHIKGSKVKDWIAYQKTTNVFIDKYLETASSLNYYWFSLGPVALGISTYVSLTEDEINLFKRFLKVFELAYQRYLDIEQAIAQAREAKIEAALEKVRAAAMSMNKPDDLLNVCEVLFTEFHKLGFDEMRNAMINIHNDEKETFINYDYSDAIGRSINHLTYNIHPVIEKQIKQIRSTNDAFSETSFTGRDLEEWKKFRQKIGEKDDPRISNLSALHYYFYSIGTGSIGVSTFNPIDEQKLELLKRFRNVFGLSYKRYSDIFLAEAQAREAQIELALERVRARTMAMQKSDELKEVVVSLFDGMKNLGVDPTVCNIALVDRKTCDTDVWTAHQTDNGMITYKVFISHFEHPFRKKLLDSFLNEIPFSVHELSGDLKKSYVQYLFEHVDYSNVPTEITKSNEELANMEDGIVLSAAYMKYGLLIVSRNHAISNDESDILQRFAKIFEQTYTRFLDLQKAEAQAREAQIEAALERVRSRTMGMQKSEELKHVIRVVNEQFIHLKINVDHAGFVVDYTPRGDWHFWIADKQEIPSKITHPFFDSVWADQFIEAKEKGIDFFATTLNFEEKNKFYRDLFKFIPGVPEESLEFYFNCPGLAGSTVLLENVGLYIENFSGTPYTDEENATLMRFGNVFQQTYTRFLDLQKAEAQAREAKIETSMEKIRSRSLTMQKPEELVEVAELLRKEMGLLGVEELETSSIYIVDKENQQAECWYAIKDIREENKRLVSDEMALILSDTWVGNEMWKFYRSKKEQISIVMRGDNRKEWINYCADKSQVLQGYYGNEIPERTYHLVKFNGGYMGAASPGNISSESWDLLKRTAAVFSLAYTRFTDLQDAAARAREAQIELALERVRARTMAMQKSEELKEVIQIVNKQFVHLNILVEHSGFIIDYKERDDMHIWLADPNQVPFQITIPYFDSPHWNSFIEAKEKGKDFFANHLSFEEKNKFYQDLFKMFHVPDDTKEYYFSCPGLAISTVLLDNVGLYIENFSGIPYTNEENNILMRFGKVFQQSYTRFLDLQKAEAQAREAQIEAALERIRSAAMAMRDSSALSELIYKFYGELTKLDAKLDRCFIMIVNSENRGITWWLAGKEGLLAENGFFIQMNQHSSHLMYLECWEKRKKKWHYLFEGKEKRDWDSFGFSNTELARLPEFIKKDMAGVKKIHLSGSSDQFGSLVTGSLEPLPEEQQDIISRFTIGFNQAFIRFLDLEKAEAQTKEAKIEASLERVRSKAMAMHSPNDLSETVNVFFKELKTLGIIPIRCGVGQIDEATRTTSLTTTTSSQQGDSLQVIGKVKQTGHPVLDGIFDHWKLQKEYFPVLEGEDIKAYYDVMNPQIGYPDYPRGKTQYGNSFPFKEGFVFAWTESKLSEEELQIFRRFTSVLSLTYRRYLDLKEAEAQAKEAHIEAALERVRARSLAMHHTSELQSVVDAVSQQLKNLDIDANGGAFISINNEVEKDIPIWGSSGAANYIQKVTIPFLDKPIFTQLRDAIKNRNDSFVEEYTHKEKIEFLQHIFNHSPWNLLPPKRKKELLSREGGYTRSLTVSRYTSIFIINHNGKKFSESDNEILKRFGKVFEQSYTRFLDLQKAEAQNKIIQAENERKSKELDEARELQLAMLPKQIPLHPKLDIKVYMQTATEVGGDYYDFSIHNDGSINIAIGDATGHGLKAGTLVTMMKSLFTANSSSKEIEDFFFSSNAAIKNSNLKRMMIGFAMLNIKDYKARFINAAMPSLYHYRKKLGKVEEIEQHNLPLGAMAIENYISTEISLNKGDILIMMSDGFPELHNPNGELFGYERAYAAIQKTADKQPEEIIKSLNNETIKWIGNKDLQDDVTFVVIKVK